MREIFVACLSALIGSQAFAAEGQIHFRGKTAASPQLIHDIAQQVATLGRAEMQCQAPSEIFSESIPLSAIPVDHRPPVSAGATITVEHWAVDLCGRVGDFMIMYWPTDNGGAGFSAELYHITNADGSDGPMPGEK
jgi:hypothetical protein